MKVVVQQYEDTVAALAEARTHASVRRVAPCHVACRERAGMRERFIELYEQRLEFDVRPRDVRREDDH